MNESYIHHHYSRHEDFSTAPITSSTWEWRQNTRDGDTALLKQSLMPSTAFQKIIKQCRSSQRWCTILWTSSNTGRSRHGTITPCSKARTLSHRSKSYYTPWSLVMYRMPPSWWTTTNSTCWLQTVQQKRMVDGRVFASRCQLRPPCLPSYDQARDVVPDRELHSKECDTHRLRYGTAPRSQSDLLPSSLLRSADYRDCVGACQRLGCTAVF